MNINSIYSFKTYLTTMYFTEIAKRIREFISYAILQQRDVTPRIHDDSERFQTFDCDGKNSLPLPIAEGESYNENDFCERIGVGSDRFEPRKAESKR